ncbi:MAG TPA: prolyl oligopeptidase family serine peptidase, partial [Cytophagaceae bacterium]
FFTSTEVSHLERHLYSINLNGKGKTKLTKAAGTHEVEISPDYRSFIDNFSSISELPTSQIFNLEDGKILEELGNNKTLSNRLTSLDIKTPENFTFNAEDGEVLYGNLIKPSNFDPKKKYPVLVYVYGGPGSQMVKNEWGGINYVWFQMLAQRGIIVATIDNRGTGGRGANFKKMTQNNLGGLEAKDLITAAKFLGTYNFIDKATIGIFGWSFGGYMASLAMTLGAEYYQVGIAVAPVTSWRFYDTIYTERFLGTPQENPKGYDDNSPLTHAAKMKGAYLLVHGTADDNVHVQNAIEMERALIKNNKHFTSFHYPDKNHSIAGGNTRYHLYTMMTDFLVKNLIISKNQK